MVAKPSADAKASGFNEKARLALRVSVVQVFFYAPKPQINERRNLTTLTFIIIVLVLSSLFRRPRYWGFPFMGGWGYRRPPMDWHHGMGGPHGMGGGFRGGPHGRF